MSSDPRAHPIDVMLRDGGRIRIRPLGPADKEKLRALLGRISAESAYFRFFSTRRRLSEAELVKYTELDFVREAALAATLSQDGGEQIVGVGRYSVLDPPGQPPRGAEVAFLVEDAHQGRGIGTHLLEQLAPIARAAGITEFEAEVLGENNRMLDVFQKSGFVIRRSFESGVFHVTFPTEETQTLVAASGERERQARAKSLRAVLNPRSVAVVGASRDAKSIGGTILANLIRDGFRGQIYPVNPSAPKVQGLPAYASVSAIGAPVDLAVVAVPERAVLDVAGDCARAGVQALVVISAGFGETGAAGREAERRLLSLVRESGMRLVGPNCLGVLNTDPEMALNATFAPNPPPAGNIGMSSQSGALALAILDYLRELNLGVSSFVSVGNKADVSGNDLLSYWAQDPRTRVIVLYLESFGNPRKFARLTPEVAREKPVIAVKSGRSAAGTRAASSHSAALASLDVAVEALFEQAGVIRTDTLEQLFDVAALLATQPVPRGKRVGVITNAGGPGILLADACEAQGLELPEPSPATREALKAFLPPQASLSNPIDMIASATAEQYRQAVAALGADPSIDSVVVIYIPVLEGRTEEVAHAIVRGLDAVPPDKTVLTVFLSARGAPPVLTSPRGRIPSYSFPENAALALAAAERYGRWRARPRGDFVRLEPFQVSVVRAVVDRVLEGASEPVWLDIEDLAVILRAIKVEFAPFEKTTTAGAVDAAGRLGYPLVMKAEVPGLLHKTDVGGVALGLRSAEDVARAVSEMEARLREHDVKLEHVLLQREVKGGIEALVGVSTDPTFGPLVVLGLGGVLVELLKDAAFRLTPVSDLDAKEMIGKLRSRKLLDGYRGAPPGDQEALVSLVQKISALVEVVPEITELDLNPVKLLAPGRGAIAVDGRMRVGRPKRPA